MRVGFDATTLTMQRTGIGRYTLELLRALARHEPDLELVLMAHRSLDADLSTNGVGALRRLRGPGLPVKLAWMQTLLPVQLAAARLDVCHFTNYHAPLASPLPMVVNLHDMSLILTPRRHPSRRVLTMRPFLRAVARRAAAVVCLTESARRDAIETLDLEATRVHAIPAAPAARFQPITDPAELNETAARYGLGPGFLLFVGTIEPRKNLVRLVESYAHLRADGFDRPLVLCGGLGWQYAELLERIDALGLQGSVRLLGFVPDDHLPRLLSLAGAFVYPSLYEGFGLPIIEALACGTPTVTSDRGAMAEVAGDAAL
ncbi:MAG: glycosyltransferase family 4 protein, partial [Candidatus Limnocylindrales bacterium]